MDPADLARAWRRRDVEDASSAAGTSAVLRERALLVAERLAARFGVRRVVLFGSVVTGGVSETSDVDLAVEGLDPGQQFAAMAEAEGILGRAVDLVRLEDAAAALVRRIAEEGEFVLETGPSRLPRGANRRPAVLAPATEQVLVELLSFWHFLRQAYAVDLDAARLLPLLDRLAEAQPAVERDLGALAEQLREAVTASPR